MLRVFVDASVLFAAAYSATGYARELIRLALDGKVTLVGSTLVIEEVKRNLANKYPEKLAAFVADVLPVLLEIVSDLTKEEILVVAAYVALKDAPVVAAAVKAKVAMLTTFDRKHLLDKPEIAEKSGVKIVTPEVVVLAIRGDDSDAS